MSDEAPAKRGRKAAAATAVIEKSDKVVETKKRARKEIKAVDDEGSDGGGDAPSPAKRGRGRPKGTIKKKNVFKGKAKYTSGTGAAATGGRRGRPKKADAKNESEEENDDAAEEEEDDE